MGIHALQSRGTVELKPELNFLASLTCMPFRPPLLLTLGSKEPGPASRVTLDADHPLCFMGFLSPNLEASERRMEYRNDVVRTFSCTVLARSAVKSGRLHWFAEYRWASNRSFRSRRSISSSFCCSCGAGRVELGLRAVSIPANSTREAVAAHRWIQRRYIGYLTYTSGHVIRLFNRRYFWITKSLQHSGSKCEEGLATVRGMAAKQVKIGTVSASSLRAIA